MRKLKSFGAHTMILAGALSVWGVVGAAAAERTCDLASSSSIVLHGAITLPLAATGSLTVNCDDPDPETAQASCACDIVQFDALPIIGIGFVCITPGTACPTGQIDCNGGDPISLDLIADKNIGTCCTGDCNGDSAVSIDELISGVNIALGTQPLDTCEAYDPIGSAEGIDVAKLVNAVNTSLNGCQGNQECGAQCEAYCSAIGKVPTLTQRGCEGFCDAGERKDEACNCDSDNSTSCDPTAVGFCPGGACNGPDNVGFGSICECQCIDRATGAPSVPGGLQCNLPSNLIVEKMLTTPPCTGIPDALLITVGTTCVPLTTDVATTELLHANNGADAFGPFVETGSPITCEALDTGTSGLKLRGVVSFFGSTIGDLATQVNVDCE